MVLNDLGAGKIENIWLLYGDRPNAAFGNSSSDDGQMLEYVKAGTGSRLSVVVVHDDAEREYAYGPALGLPYSQVGTLSQAMYDMAKKTGLDDRQHEERLEAHLRLPEVKLGPPS